MSSVLKAVKVLRCLSSEATRLTVTEVSRRLDLPKSSVSRLMREMMDCGLLQRDDRIGAYSPGVLLFQLGNLYRQHFNLFDLIDETVKRLVAETGHTGYIGVLQEGDLVALRSFQGRHPVRYVMEAGQRGPAYGISLGKALLARKPDDELRALYSERLDPVVSNAPERLEDLLAEIAVIRERGWATANSRLLPGVRSIGVAVGGADQDQAVGFSLSYLAAVLSDDDVDALTARIVASAAEVGRRTADPHWGFR